MLEPLINYVITVKKTSPHNPFSHNHAQAYQPGCFKYFYRIQ
jgi:hypothetical protein